MEGYIKLHRKLTNWKYSTNPQAFRIWVELILSATHKSFKSGTWTIKPGQWKGSNRQLSLRTGVSRKVINRWIKQFEEDKMIRVKNLPDNTGAIYTIVKYKDYQDDKTGHLKPHNLATYGAAHNNVTIGDDSSKEESRPNTIDW